MARRLLPRHAPFGGDVLSALDRVLAGASSMQRAWLSDYLVDGLATGGLPAARTEAVVSVGEVVECINLNSSRSDRATMHVAVAFGESPPSYEAGAVLELLEIDGAGVPACTLAVASSRKEVADEVHAVLSVEPATAPVAERLRLGSSVRVRMREEAAFRLPPDPEADLVMIGVEAGVAPYRAFMQERRALGARRRSWLIFGGRRFTHDFLYQLEWQAALADGSLTRIDLAFSHDQPERIGVEDRLFERRQPLVEWIEEGAILYLCADPESAERARAGLVRSIAAAKACGPDAAIALVSDLARQSRFRQRHP